MNDHWTYSVLDLQLDIAPIAGGLKPSSTQVPRDLPQDDTKTAMAAVAFRGLIPANRELKFRPEAPMTRLEFASALARSAHLPSPNPSSVQIRDVAMDTDDIEEVLEIVAAHLMGLDTSGNFHPNTSLTSVDAAVGLRKLIEYGAPMASESTLAEIAKLQAAKDNEVTRGQVAVLLHAILRLPK